MDNTIPKIIHYCWFGKGKKNKLIKRCMKTWKKNMPDYKIREWNEDSFDISSNKYIMEAYQKRKYAFVSDYVRLYALYNYGGVYFDTDVEVVRNISNIIINKDIYGFEKKNMVMTAVMITRPKSSIIKEFLDIYENLSFINKDGTINTIANTVRFTEILKQKGLNCNNKKQTLDQESAEIYPIEYFCAYDIDNSHFIPTENTFTIHHYDGSWVPKRERCFSYVKKKVSMLLGLQNYDKLRRTKNRLRKKCK